tara:strand:+ start:404 stop:2599 length:2196 start_codon:yes stop_codon:yes gene_type:complete
MGFDGLISFLIRNLPNDSFDEVNLIKNYNKIISKYILIDISFILYNCYIELEDDINLILKYIFSLSCTDYSKVVKLIEEHLKKPHWEKYKIPLDGDSQEDISDKFIKYLINNDNEIFFKILSEYTCNKIKLILDNLFELNFTSEIILFFDSIPSYSKILEQRKRRIKNFRESKNRKKYYSKYFSDLENDNIVENGIEYDYFNWIEKKFNCNKIIDSNSIFVKKLKDHIISNLKFDRKIIVKVDEEEFGEADYKIFKYISKNNLEDKVTMLSCDSDLVYQLILQQHNYNYLGKKIELSLFKFYINSFDYCQYFSSNKILNHIENSYIDNNNLSDKRKNNFVLDFLFLLNFFGNDFLPSSFEIGPELSFNGLIKSHFCALKDNKKVINFKTDSKLKYFIDFKNLKLWLDEISKNSSMTKIILLRYYKVPYNITFILTEKLNLSLEEIKNNLLKPYLIYKGSIYNDSLDDNDIRKLLYKEFILQNNNTTIIENPLTEKFYNQNLLTSVQQLDELLEHYLDYTDIENLGLLDNSIKFDLDENMYQNLYNYISRESNISYSKRIFNFDYKIEESSDDKIEEYLLMLNFIVDNFFNDMEHYKSTNLTRYTYDKIPSLKDISKFIEKTDCDKLKVKFDSKIQSNILEKNQYFDSILHHLIITPYLLDSNYLNLLDNKEMLRQIIFNFTDSLNLIWTNGEEDLFNKVNPKIILRDWNNILLKINHQNKIELKNNFLIEF